MHAIWSMWYKLSGATPRITYAARRSDDASYVVLHRTVSGVAGGELEAVNAAAFRAVVAARDASTVTLPWMPCLVAVNDWTAHFAKSPPSQPVSAEDVSVSMDALRNAHATMPPIVVHGRRVDVVFDAGT
jgi:hypothetical protein